jgi:hypothetical protein
MPPPRNVSTVHPNLLFIGQLGEQLATKRGQPSGSIARQDTLEETQAKLGNLYDWAKMRGDGTDQGYLVDAWHGEAMGKKGALIGPARIARTTLDDELEQRFYGPAYGEVRAAATANTPPPSVKHPFGNLDKQLQSPLYMVSHPEGSTARSGADVRGFIEISPGDAKKYGVSRDAVSSHELGHHVSPVYGASREYQKRIGWFAERLLRDHPNLKNNPGILDFMARRHAYLSTPPERAAIGHQYRRAEYGVSGNKMTTEGDIIRALRGIMDSPPQPIAKPSMKVDALYPADPIMQYGPGAGKPAEGYNTLRNQLRLIYEGLNNNSKREVIDILKSGASTSNPNEVMYG